MKNISLVLFAALAMSSLNVKAESLSCESNAKKYAINLIQFEYGLRDQTAEVMSAKVISDEGDGFNNQQFEVAVKDRLGRTFKISLILGAPPCHLLELKRQ